MTPHITFVNTSRLLWGIGKPHHQDHLLHHGGCFLATLIVVHLCHHCDSWQPHSCRRSLLSWRLFLGYVIHVDNFTNYVLRLFSAAFMLLMMTIPSIIPAVFSCIQISDKLRHYDTVISAFMLTMTSLISGSSDEKLNKLKPNLLLISVRT
jgi:hypothetical protein